MISFEKILRILVAVVIGEILLVLGTTLAQEIIFDDIAWESSSPLELLGGGIGSFLAAVISGASAYLIVKKANVIPNVILSILILAETIWLINSGKSQEPMWFSSTAGAMLILGIWVGRFVIGKYPKTAKA